MRSAITSAGRASGAAPSRAASTEVVIVGGGGHGLAAAYYLAKNHGITNVAVIEKGWLGGGNTAATRRSFARTTISTPTRIFMSIR